MHIFVSFYLYQFWLLVLLIIFEFDCPALVGLTDWLTTVSCSVCLLLWIWIKDSHLHPTASALSLNHECCTTIAEKQSPRGNTGPVMKCLGQDKSPSPERRRNSFCWTTQTDKHSDWFWFWWMYLFFFSLTA